MKTKIILSLLIAFGLSFQSCEKEDSVTPSTDTKSSKERGLDSKSTSYGSISNANAVYTAAFATESHFISIGETPTASQWNEEFISNYDNSISTPESFANESEMETLLDDYYDDILNISHSQSDSLSLDSILQSNLDIVASNEKITSSEKDYLSNAIYILNAGIDVANNIATIAAPERPHPWHIAFNSCMRARVPDGFFSSLAWVLSGDIFLDVGDCMVYAFSVT